MKRKSATNRKKTRSLFYVAAIGKKDEADKEIQFCLREVVGKSLSPLLVYANFNPNSRQNCKEIITHIERMLKPGHSVLYMNGEDAAVIDSALLKGKIYYSVLLNSIVDTSKIEEKPVILKADAMAKEFILSQISASTSIGDENAEEADRDEKTEEDEESEEEKAY